MSKHKSQLHPSLMSASQWLCTTIYLDFMGKICRIAAWKGISLICKQVLGSRELDFGLGKCCLVHFIPKNLHLMHWGVCSCSCIPRLSYSSLMWYPWSMHYLLSQTAKHPLLKKQNKKNREGFFWIAKKKMMGTGVVMTVLLVLGRTRKYMNNNRNHTKKK